MSIHNLRPGHQGCSYSRAHEDDAERAVHGRMEIIGPLTMDQELQELLQEFYATRAAPRPHSRPYFLDPQIGPYKYIARSQSRPSLWLSRARRPSWPQRLSCCLLVSCQRMKASARG